MEVITPSISDTINENGGNYPIGLMYYYDRDKERWQWAADITVGSMDASGEAATMDKAISNAVKRYRREIAIDEGRA